MACHVTKLHNTFIITMKPPPINLLTVLALAAFSASAAFGQADQLPVSRTAGIIPVSLPNNVTTLMALPLTEVIASGTIVSGGGTTTLTLAAAVGNVTTNPHAIKITSRYDQRGTGANAPAGASTNAYGTMARITAGGSGTTVTTDVALSPNAGDEFIIVRLETLASVFGGTGSSTAIVAGWKSGLTAGAADLVYVDNGAGVLTPYFHRSGGSGGWRLTTDTATNQNNVAILPGRGLLVQRQSGTDVTVNVTGDETIGLEKPTVAVGFNVINNPFTIDTTLKASGIQNHITGALSVGSADVVYLENAGVLTGYYWRNTSWRTAAGNVDSDAVVVRAGKSILFQEANGTAGFALPQPFNE